jgi:hypothetical protein
MYTEKDIPVGPGEWQIWRHLPTTEAIFDALMEERSVIVQRLALGETLDRPGSEIKETAIAVGTVQGLTIILDDLELVLQQQWQEAEQRKLDAELEEEI